MSRPTSLAGKGRLALGLRLTLHDPHDPIAASQMPEAVAAVFRQAGESPPDPARRDLQGSGVDLTRIYVAHRQALRARAGDAQVSAGWATSLPLDGSQGTADFGGTHAAETRHTTWIAAQYTFGPRFDLIANIQGRDLFGRQSRAWLAAALLRKAQGVDVRGGLVYDAANNRVYPSLAGSGRLTRRTRALATIGAQPPPHDLDGQRRLVAGIQGQWFFASDPHH